MLNKIRFRLLSWFMVKMATRDAYMKASILRSLDEQMGINDCCTEHQVEKVKRLKALRERIEKITYA